MGMPRIPRQEYRDLFYVINFGPFDAADFVTVGYSEASISATSVSSLSDTTSISSPSGTSLSSEAGLITYNSCWCPDKDTFIDHAWLRAENISTDDLNRLRLLVVKNGQSIKAAWRNRQYVTDRLNVGDSSASSSGSNDEFDAQFPYPGGKIDAALRPFTGTEWNINPANHKIPAFGKLVVLAEEVPDNLVDLMIGVRVRERRVG